MFVSPFVSLPAFNFFEIILRISIKFGIENLICKMSGAFKFLSVSYSNEKTTVHKAEYHYSERKTFVH